jgi:hypothetical protein
MLYPKTWVIKRTKTPGIESPPNSTKNLGSNRNPSIEGRIRSLGDQDQAQRCTGQLSMIPTNKSEPNTSKSKEQVAHEKPTKIARKRHENPMGYKPGIETTMKAFIHSEVRFFTNGGKI